MIEIINANEILKAFDNNFAVAKKEVINNLVGQFIIPNPHVTLVHNLAMNTLTIEENTYRECLLKPQVYKIQHELEDRKVTKLFIDVLRKFAHDDY